MSDPNLLAAGGAPGTPPPGTPPPGAPGAAPPAGEPSGEFKPAYESQLSKRLQNPEIYAKLASAGGPNLDHLVDAYLTVSEKAKQFDGRVLVPVEGDKPEAWDPVWKQLGVPESDDGYQFDRSGEFKDLPTFDGLDAWQKQTFRELKLTAHQGSELFKRNATKTLELAKAIKAQAEARATECVRTLEAAHPKDYATWRSDFNKTIEGFFGKENMADPWNNPVFIEKLASLGVHMRDATIHGGGAPGKSEPTTVRGALADALG